MPFRKTCKTEVWELPWQFVCIWIYTVYFLHSERVKGRENSFTMRAKNSHAQRKIPRVPLFCEMRPHLGPILSYVHLSTSSCLNVAGGPIEWGCWGSVCLVKEQRSEWRKNSGKTKMSDIQLAIVLDFFHLFFLSTLFYPVLFCFVFPSEFWPIWTASVGFLALLAFTWRQLPKLRF